MAAAPIHYTALTVTKEARKSFEELMIALTVKYRRRFTISEAVNQAAEDICREIYAETADAK
jgi:hypothetical protein